MIRVRFAQNPRSYFYLHPNPDTCPDIRTPSPHTHYIHTQYAHAQPHPSPRYVKQPGCFFPVDIDYRLSGPDATACPTVASALGPEVQQLINIIFDEVELGGGE